MAEAEAVLTGELRSVRSDQLPADERGEVRGHLGLRGCERLDGAPMEDLALDRPPLEDAAFGGLELIEASREQSSERGRNDHLAAPIAGHRHHLLDEERVAAGRAGDLRAELARDTLAHELLDVLGGQRLEPKRHRPGGAASAELRPCHAEQQDRCVRGQQRDMFDQVVERLFAPLDVVEHDNQRSLCRRVFQGLAECPRDLLGRGHGVSYAEQRADRRRGLLGR